MAIERVCGDAIGTHRNTINLATVLPLIRRMGNGPPSHGKCWFGLLVEGGAGAVVGGAASGAARYLVTTCVGIDICDYDLRRRRDLGGFCFGIRSRGLEPDAPRRNGASLSDGDN